MAETRLETRAGSCVELEEPKMYAVIIHNDDYTSMDFVVMILTKVFLKSGPEAESLMLEVHRCGRGVAGAYILDIAMSKKMLAEKLAAENGFPLRLTLEIL